MGRWGLLGHTQANVLDVSLEGMLSFYTKCQTEIDMYSCRWKSQQQQGRGICTSSTASLRACLAESYWIKRKVAVHGTMEWQTLEAKSCSYMVPWSGNQLQEGLFSWEVSLMHRAAKTKVRDDVPLESRRPLPEITFVLCLETGLMQGVSSAYLVSLAYTMHYFTLGAFLSFFQHAPFCHRTFVHDGPISPHLFAKLAHTLSLTNPNSIISSSVKSSFIPTRF